jgi:hypothetical protein
MIVYNSDYVLNECLESILNYGPLLVTEGPCGYWANHKIEPDWTRFILESYWDYGQGIKKIKHGVWTEKDQMQNAVMDYVPRGTTHMFLVDSDEVWDGRNIERIAELIEEYDYDSMDFTADSFFGGFDHILTGFERSFPVTRVQRYYEGARWKTHRPPTILSPQGKPWKKHRHCSMQTTLAQGITMHHYSYVFPSQARMKHKYYSYYMPGITIPNYVDEVFMPWVIGNEKQRKAIEKKWKGVHNFIPSYRKDLCYPQKYEGEHPASISNNMKNLKLRLQKEIECEIQNMKNGSSGKIC